PGAHAGLQHRANGRGHARPGLPLRQGERAELGQAGGQPEQGVAAGRGGPGGGGCEAGGGGPAAAWPGERLEELAGGGHPRPAGAARVRGQLGWPGRAWVRPGAKGRGGRGRLVAC
ncbi:unnamed protein product, partial [Heterosigma akashiwo]